MGEKHGGAVRPGFPKGAVQRLVEAGGGFTQGCRIGLRHEGADRLILDEGSMDGVEMMVLDGMGRGGEGEQIAILKAVLPYLWPAGRFDLKLRVVLALLCLVLAKVVTVLTPFAYKYAVDALTGAQSTQSAQAAAVLLIAGPIAMVG